MAQSRSIVRPAGDPLVGTSPTDTRLALAALLGRAAAAAFGVRPGVLWGGTVSGTADWSYNVAPCALVMARGGAGEGAYPAAITGSQEVETDPAPGTGSRIDIVYALQPDPDLGDSDNDPVLAVAIGTASGSPVAPSLPTGALELGRATITSSMTQTLDATVATTAAITTTAGGVYETPSVQALSRIVDPLVGELARAGTSQLARFNGTAWDVLFPVGEWQDYTPTLGNVTLGNGTLTGRYSRIGDTVRGVARLAFGSTTSVSDIIRISAPTSINLTTHPQNIAPVGNAVASDTSNRAYGTLSPASAEDFRIGGVTQGSFTSLSWDSNFPFASWASGYSIYLTFEYEAADS